MSRLIDADALKESLKIPIVMDEDRAKRLWEGWHECTIAVDEAINKAPTIEPKTGKWILTEEDDYEYCTCSECGYQNGENWMIGSDIPFCAMCGADMRGDDHEND